MHPNILGAMSFLMYFALWGEIYTEDAWSSVSDARDHFYRDAMLDSAIFFKKGEGEGPIKFEFLINKEYFSIILRLVLPCNTWDTKKLFPIYQKCKFNWISFI